MPPNLTQAAWTAQIDDRQSAYASILTAESVRWVVRMFENGGADAPITITFTAVPRLFISIVLCYYHRHSGTLP